MSLAWISVSALGLAILLSCTTSVNVGVVSLIFAWLVGVHLAGMPLDEVLRGFPVSLFVNLVGITLLFSMAQRNGTLERITAQSVRLVRGHAALIPVLFFALAALVSSIGPGGTATAALLAPPALAAGQRAGVSPFLMIIMLGNGALAGTFSPFAPGGIVANGVMARIGLGGVEWQTYAANLLAHATVAFTAYFLLGGWRRLPPRENAGREPVVPGLDRWQWLTLVLIAALIVGVVGFSLNVGMAALAAAIVLSLCRAVDEQEAFRRMPWGVIVMVTGVTVLIALVEKTEGIHLFTDLLVRLSTTRTVTAVTSFTTGLVSVYHSTSGVVLPAFLPVVPRLAARLGGVNPLSLAWSMNVGASLVDLSPLSTVGALCLAAAPEGSNTRDLFLKLMAWGLSMTIVGAFLSWAMFGWMR